MSWRRLNCSELLKWHWFENQAPESLCRQLFVYRSGLVEPNNGKAPTENVCRICKRIIDKRKKGEIECTT